MSGAPPPGSSPPDPEPGWYPHRGELRYWTGNGWSQVTLGEPEPTRESNRQAGPDFKGPAETVTSVLGALAGAAAVVAIPGAISMILRLKDHELPVDIGVVTSLPNQFLLGIGLTYILLPLLVLSGIAIFVTVVPGGANESNPALRASIKAGPPSGRDEWKEFVETGARLSIWVFVVVGIGAALYAAQVTELGLGKAIWVVTLALLTVLVWRVLAGRIARSHSERSIASPSALLLTTTLTTTLFLPWAIAFSVNEGELPRATVCRADGERLDGYLIGQTDGGVYLGELPTRIVLLGSGPEDQTLLRDAEGTLRSGGYDVRRAASPQRISFGRVGLVIANLDQLNDGEVSRLFAEPETAHVRVLAFTEDPTALPPGLPVDFDLSQRSEIATRSSLRQLVAEGLEGVKIPERPHLRITSIPSGHVERLLIGTLGPCPAVGEGSS